MLLNVNMLISEAAAYIVWIKRISMQSELPRPIPRYSVESDHGCTSRIYFDNAGDNVTLTVYNVTLTSHIPCWHNNKVWLQQNKRL